MKSIKKLPKTAVIIILAVLALLQLLYIILSARPKEKTDFDIYLETQSLPLYSIGLEQFSFSVPQQWADSWTDSSSLAEDMKNYYLNNDGSSEYSYEDKVICVRNDSSIQIIKRGEFYINLAVADCPYQGISYSKIFSRIILLLWGLIRKVYRYANFGEEISREVIYPTTPFIQLKIIIFTLLLKTALW